METLFFSELTTTATILTRVEGDDFLPTVEDLIVSWSVLTVSVQKDTDNEIFRCHDSIPPNGARASLCPSVPSLSFSTRVTLVKSLIFLNLFLIYTMDLNGLRALSNSQSSCKDANALCAVKHSTQGF